MAVIKSGRGNAIMAMTANRKCIEQFLSAFYSGHLQGALDCCDEEIDFLSHVPIEILPHMGHRHGKAEVLEMWQAIHGRYSHMRYDLPFVAEEGDSAAVIIRVYFRKSDNDRIVHMDIADFYRFRDGRILQLRQFMDSFDLAQQLLEQDIASPLIEKRSK